MERIVEIKQKKLINDASWNQMLEFVRCFAEEMKKQGRMTPAEMEEIFRIIPQCVIDLQDYHFTPHHTAVTEPIDYYTWGNRIWGALIDVDNSKFEGMDNLKLIDKYIQQKHNVVILSNHQIEPDAQILSATFERHGHGDLAKKIMLVAGNRVRDDPISVPFSIGHNLLCVHSKKYIDHPQSQKAQKLQDNLTAMQSLQALFKEGGQLIWIAPSGGRDRRDENGRLQLSPFDPKNIQMIALMAKKSRTPIHYFPMALHSSSIAPPPQESQAQIVGESRACKFSPIGVYLGEEVTEYADADSLTAAAEARVRENYDVVRQT